MIQMALREIVKYRGISKEQVCVLIIKHRNDNTTVSKMIVDSCLFSTKTTYGELRTFSYGKKNEEKYYAG
ncbi:hypothetical protein X953_01445 [Virgibacillus sp. SK37]|nr:hypothetical protein X953_01445 [Virgibacillus sp. SK37]